MSMLLEMVVIHIAHAVGMSPKDYAVLLPKLWEGWICHPGYQEWKARMGFKDYRKLPIPDLISPMAVGCFSHEPGDGGLTESYIVADVQSIASRLEWAAKNMGTFTEIVPLEPHVPIHQYMIVYLNHSLMGRGKGYFSRKRLKELLPKRLHRAISLTRTMNRRPKSHLAEYTGWSLDDYDFEAHEPNYPDEYRQKTKRELVIEYILAPQFPELSAWIDLESFWQAVTGKVEHPDQIADMMKKEQGYTHKKRTRDGSLVTQDSMFAL